MSNQILIPSDLIAEDDLDNLVASIKTAIDADGYIEKQYVVTSDSPALLAALQSLFNAPPVGVQEKPKKTRKKSAKVVAKNSGASYARSYRITGGAAPIESIGTYISAVELSKKLVARALPLGTELSHSKRGKVIVSLNGDPDGPYVIKGAGETQ